MKQFRIRIKEIIYEDNSIKDVGNKIAEVAKIFNTSMIVDICELENKNDNKSQMEYEDYVVTNEKITMRNLKDYFGTSKKNSILLDNKINWQKICKKYILSEGVLNAFSAKVDWNQVCNRVNNGDYYKFSKEFIAEYGSIFDSYNPFTNVSEISITDIEEPVIDEIENFYDPELVESVEEGLYNTPLTPESFKKIIDMNPDDFFEECIDQNALVNLSKDCILTKEFVFKYEKYISFKDLKDNKKCFNDLMMDGEFFDRYIDKFIEIKKNEQ